MRITRPFVLLALAALLAPRIEASRTSVWESNPSASLTATRADAASLLASLAPAGPLENTAANAELTEPPRLDLGDIVLVESELEHGGRFDLGPLELLGPAPLRGPPPSYPETRVRDFELLPPFRIGASPRLSLWSRQACSFPCLGLVSDSRYDPWGLCAFGLPCPKAAQAAIDWAGIFADASVSNFKSGVGLLSEYGQKGADLVSGGATAGFRRALSVAASAKGTAAERSAAVGRAFLSGQANSLSLGFLDASDKTAHAKELVGVGAIDRGTKRSFEGALSGDWGETLRGNAEAVGGIGQLSGTAAAVYAPFAPGPVPAQPDELIGPKQPRAYSTAFEMELDPSQYGLGRGRHCTLAKQKLQAAMQADDAFAAGMDEILGAEGAWTWEHASSTTANGRLGVMRLVPRSQHTPGSAWWRLLHPDKGASGGYAEWAIPNGAPRN